MLSWLYPSHQGGSTLYHMLLEIFTFLPLLHRSIKLLNTSHPIASIVFICYYPLRLPFDQVV